METVLSDGRMQDLSGHVNHGTMTGTTDIAGKIGRARHFNAGDRITASAIPVYGLDFTVAAWFRWTTNPSPYYGGIHGGGNSWELRVEANGHFSVFFYQAIAPDVFTAVESPFAYNDGTWHHVAGVLRSGLAELYVDGVLVAQDPTNPIASVRTSTQTIVGKIASDFVGDVDEVFLYSRALTTQEIAALTSGSTSNVQDFGANLSSRDLGTFAQSSCSVMRSPTPISTPIEAHAVTITEANGWLPGTTWFSPQVAGAHIIYVEMATVVLRRDGSRANTSCFVQNG